MVLEAFLFDGLLGDYVAGCEEYLGWALARRILDVSLLSLSFISRRLESWGGGGGEDARCQRLHSLRRKGGVCVVPLW